MNEDRFDLGDVHFLVTRLGRTLGGSALLGSFCVVPQRRFCHTEGMERLYADVEYFDRVYLDAELIENHWYCEDPFGAVHPFTVQYRVRPVNNPQLIRRHPPSRSGHCVRQESSDSERP